MTNADFNPEGSPRKPGRPSNAELAARAQAQQQPAEENPRARELRAETVRRERRFRADTSEAAGYQLGVPAEQRKPEHEYRWVNDKANGRIQALEGRDWDVVKNAAIDGTGEGTPVNRVVGTSENGQPLRAYLMEKPADWHKEDQARKNAPRIETEETMKRGPLPQKDGFEPGIAYVPQGHRNVIGQT